MYLCCDTYHQKGYLISRQRKVVKTSHSICTNSMLKMWSRFYFLQNICL
jgi:hypothetical protein